MQGFRQQKNALIWEQDHETVQIEPWGQDSLRVRATMGPEIRDDLPGALLEPAFTEAQIEIGAEHALVRNGAIAAEVSARGNLRFFNTATSGELLAGSPSHFPRPLARQFKPVWAAGFWQCKLRYRTQEELLSVAREHKRRGLPLSVIVADFFHWTMQGDWQFDPECWPDPAAMVHELEEMRIKLMVSIWPTVNALSPNFEEMQRRGLLVRTERGVPAHMPFTDTKPEGRVYVHYYDPTNPEARHFPTC